MYTACLQVAPGRYGIFAGPSAETLLKDVFNVMGRRHFSSTAEAMAAYNEMFNISPSAEARYIADSRGKVYFYSPSDEV